MSRRPGASACEPFTFGRSPECSAVLPAAGRGVSRNAGSFRHHVGPLPDPDLCCSCVGAKARTTRDICCLARDLRHFLRHAHGNRASRCPPGPPSITPAYAAAP